jgi:hypothetical protein
VTRYRVVAEIVVWTDDIVVPPRPAETGDAEADNEALEAWAAKENRLVEDWLIEWLRSSSAELRSNNTIEEIETKL